MRNRNVKINTTIIAVFCILGFFLIEAYAYQSDNSDGTFTNPVLYADYPDPDIIRVGEDFCMVSTTFADSPGLTVLRSQDLVNWDIISHAASVLDMNSDYDMLNGQTAYRRGIWASSIRYYNGMFYIVVNPWGASGARVYYASDPAGPWNYHQLDRGAHDPGFFIDDDGTGYIFYGSGSLSVLTLNSDYSAVVSQRNNVVNGGGEGSHVVKRGSYYYLFNANPSVWPFQLRCSRATNIFGPWETGHICLLSTNGGHQGAIVDIDDNDNWFGFVHQDSGSVGRMTRIGPVFWENDWPVFGTTSRRNVIASTYTKPIQGEPVMQPPTSDDFDSSTLGLQWQWNHNPDNTRWSLTERPGWLRLKATQADGFWTARNTLTQKGQGPWSRGEVKFDLQNLEPGDICGFGTLGKYSAYIAVNRGQRGDLFLSMNVLEHTSGGIQTDTRVTSVPIQSDMILLRTDLDFENDTGLCSYSFDGIVWMSLGGEFPLAFDWATGTFQGEKFAIFCYNSNVRSSNTGYVDVDYFTFSDTDIPITIQRGRPTLNESGTTFLADNGNLLRGPFASTEWGNPPSASTIESIRALGCNAIHLYGECFDMDYPQAGSTAPGYARNRIDQMVDMTRDAGIYLIITIGNGSNNGRFNYDYIMDFWDFYAPRYKDETHVLYEIQNEPHAWSAPYPHGALDMEADAYTLIRSKAPDTPVLLFSFAVLSSGPLAISDIRSVSTAASIDWTNAAVAVHGYAGHETTTTSIEHILGAGYPCFMTEFTAAEWGSDTDTLAVELTAELERLEVSWATFQHIPPNFIGTAITDPNAFYDRVNRAGLSWTPDFGFWPVSRGVYGNDDRPWATTGLSGTLRIQPEDFDTGGQGVAYSDTEAANQGGQYRTGEGVDIETTSDSGGGYNVNWINDGEWLEYTIFVTEPGFYELGLRVAGPNSQGVTRVICNGTDRTGDWTLPITGGAQVWTTVTRDVFLEYGRQKLRVEVIAGGFNLNWIELSPTATGPIANGNYKFLNHNSGLALKADTSNTCVVQNLYSGTSLQQWRIQHRGAGQYSIVSASNGWSWSTFYDKNEEPLNLAPWGYDGHADRRFIVIPTDNGYHRIVVVDGGLCIQVEGAALTNDAAAQQYEYTGDNHQQWGILSPSALAFPTGLSATATTSTQIDLTWTTVNGATSYKVKRSTISGGPYTTIATGVTATEYRDTELIEGCSYYYVVSAVSGRRESLESAEATVVELTGLHAHLKFDESRGTSASDATGNGWMGTLIGGTKWSSGKFGNAVDLDGNNDYVRLPAGVVDGLTDFTICTWVKLNTASTWSRVFDIGTGTTANMFLTADSWGGARFAITTSGSDGEQRIDKGSALPLGTWTHVAVTLGSGRGILYVDGVEVGRNNNMTLTPDSLGVTTQNYIGKSQYSWDAYLYGLVDDFRIYSETLSSSEVATLARQ